MGSRTLGTMEAHQEGDWVHHSDYAELKRQHDILFDALVGLINAPADGGINTSDAISDALAALNTVKALRA